MEGTGGTGGSLDRRGGTRNELRDVDAATIMQVGGVHGDMNVTMATPRAEVPRQVPSPPFCYVDRHDDGRRLSELLADMSRPTRIVVVTGPPGIGKSAMVRHWVYGASGRFPGGELYVDCADFAGTGEGDTDVSGMLASCLRAFGVDERHMPATLTERKNLFRTRTAVRPVLVVVENTTEPAQVTALVPRAPGSAVLVTSGADLTELRMDGVVFHALGRLDDDSGSELLGEISGNRRTVADPAAVSLVRACAGLPIAIVVLAARAADGDAVTLIELAEELADDGRRLAGLSMGGKQLVSTAFSASYQRLPEAARRMYRRLGLLPGVDFDSSTAAVAASVDVETARRLLDVLASAYLVERRGGGRYGFHELLRLHARQRAIAEEPAEHREAVVDQVVRYYLVRAAFADRALRGDRTRITDHAALLAEESDPFAGPDAAERALGWLDGERANLVAVVRAAFDAGWDAQAWRLAEALTVYYPDRRHLADWIATGDLGARAAHRLGDVRAEARLRSMLSRPYSDLGESDRAGAESGAAVELAERTDDLALRASAWEFHGRVLDSVDRGRALDAYEKAHELNVRAGEWRGVALVLQFVGRCLDAMGRSAEALESLERALDLFRWLDDTRMAGRVLIGIGTARFRLGDIAAAVAFLERAVRDLTGRHYEAEARELLAEIAEGAGDHEAARDHLRRAMAIYSEVGHPRAEEPAARPNPTDQ